MKKHISIAIDGPSGAGKSTLARLAAKHFGYIYVDTGAIYRCVGLFVLRAGADPSDTDAVERLLSEIDIEMRYDGQGVQRMLLCGEDVSSDIRLPEVSMYASKVSAIPAVRRFLLGMQREMAEKHDVVMDGRDIGTVVLPDADVKIFLTASANERARRRYEELCTKGLEVSFDEVLADMIQRDRNDESRAAAPLKAADDAVLLDTTGNTLDESAELIIKTVKDRLT